MEPKTKIKALVYGYPPRKRKPVPKWLDADPPEHITPENINDLATHWIIYKQVELGWRDCHVKAFGEFKVEMHDVSGIGPMTFESVFPSRQWEIKKTEVTS